VSNTAISIQSCFLSRPQPRNNVIRDSDEEGGYVERFVSASVYEVEGCNFSVSHVLVSCSIKEATNGIVKHFTLKSI